MGSNYFWVKASPLQVESQLSFFERDLSAWFSCVSRHW